MRKKELLCLLVVLVSIAAMAGCGGRGKETAGTSNTSNTGPVDKASVESVTISIGSTGPTTRISHFHQFLVKFKEEVEKETEGKVSIKLHPNSELGGEREMIEAVQLGVLDAVITGSGPLGNFAPLTLALDFPFLFRGREHAYTVLDGELGVEIGKQMEEKGFKLIVWAENGIRNITNNKRPIKKPEDLEGLKIRTQENKVHLDTFRQYGADPTPMAFPELFTSLQQGVVDGQENPWSVIVPHKFYEVQKYITLTGHFYQAAPLIINKAKFDGFSPELQQIIQTAAENARDYEREFIAEMNEEFMTTAKENGMEVVSADEFDRDAFVKASAKVYEKYDAEFGDFIRRIKEVK